MSKPPPFRLTEEVTPEQKLHEAVVSMLTIRVKPPAFWACYPAGHVQLTSAQTAKLTRAGLKRGVPDLLVWHDGHSYGIELKRAGAKLSKGYMARTRRGTLVWRAGQAEVFPLLEAAGMVIGVCDSPEAVVGMLQGWGIPLRRAS